MRSALTVAILAGGASSRMGRDKAGVAFHGKTLGERAADLALALSDDVIVLGHGRGMPEDLPRLPDPALEQGPLGGIAALVAHAVRTHVVVLPVDVPFLDAPHVGALVDALADADIASYEGHPLPCALRARVLATLPTHGALHRAFAAHRWRTLALDDAQQLENINASEDLARASRRE